MIPTTERRTGTERRNSNGAATRPDAFGRERRVSVRRVSVEQEKADVAAWLREYRRWTQTGCCAPTRNDGIEWGGKDQASH